MSVATVCLARARPGTRPELGQARELLRNESFKTQCTRIPGGGGRRIPSLSHSGWQKCGATAGVTARPGRRAWPRANFFRVRLPVSRCGNIYPF